MDGRSAGMDELTRWDGEGLQDYLARLEALDLKDLGEEQRCTLEALLRAVRGALRCGQLGGPPGGQSPDGGPW